MIFRKWLPWGFIIQKVARRYGFFDPVTLLARLRRFGHPSEVQEPIELLRAGVLFHARGLVNTRAIQYNLDWVWPFWVVKQFTPKDASFIPRGFSFSHINLTHRNWTAVGIPGLDLYPIVDPRGLVTPHWDGWSMDVWLISGEGEGLFPSREDQASQSLSLSPALKVETFLENRGFGLKTSAHVSMEKGNRPTLVLEARGEIQGNDGWMIISIRPYNPEGIRFIDHIHYRREENRLRINHEQDLYFESVPDKVIFSNYACGDVAHHLESRQSQNEVECPIGMATAAAFFPARIGNENRVRMKIPLTSNPDSKNFPAINQARLQPALEKNSAKLKIPDSKFCSLYDSAVQTLLLLTGPEVYPGPYTYKRFWFRDACFLLNTLLELGLPDKCRRLMEKFPNRQKQSGYFQSQEGEWDSNGQVLWLAGRYRHLTGKEFDLKLVSSLIKGARWIINKQRNKGDKKKHDGLLPAGFSAEHLGPNDYYYWDNFWAIAGLNAASGLAASIQDKNLQQTFSDHAALLENRVFASIMGSPGQIRYNAIPASCYRRMDAGAVGSLVADYPLQITQPGDPLIMNTVSFLMDHCFYGDGFFQDMIHSGINAYLTLDIAQTLLRNNDKRYRSLIRNIADLASPTGQWPEAIHPLTGGGCMGDGQHAWASAEWIMMMKSLFIREEGERLILGSGIFPEWLEHDGILEFGPTLIPAGGTLCLRLVKTGDDLVMELNWNRVGSPIRCIAMVPGYKPEKMDTNVARSTLTPV